MATEQPDYEAAEALAEEWDNPDSLPNQAIASAIADPEKSPTEVARRQVKSVQA